MKITLCGSIAFIKEMAEMQQKLESQGHEVQMPPLKEVNDAGQAIDAIDYYNLKKEGADKNQWLWDKHHQRIQRHFDKIAWSDAILVLNYDKNQIAGYIGPNTLMEMGLAFYLKKPIFLLNNIPSLPHTEEILGLKPIVINQDLTKIKV